MLPTAKLRDAGEASSQKPKSKSTDNVSPQLHPLWDVALVCESLNQVDVPTIEQAEALISQLESRSKEIGSRNVAKGGCLLWEVFRNRALLAAGASFNDPTVAEKYFKMATLAQAQLDRAEKKLAATPEPVPYWKTVKSYEENERERRLRHGLPVDNIIPMEH